MSTPLISDLEFKKMEEERMKINKLKAEEEAKSKVKEVKEKENKGDGPVLPDNVSSSVQKFLTDSYEDEEEDADNDVRLKGDEDQVGMKVNGKTRTTIRNLRIREDTAKYLINLDPNSAYYDPKTRSMRSNPLPFKDPSQLEFAGENWTRHSGEAKSFQKIQSYSVEANDKGQSVHMQAAPSQSELLHRDFAKKKEALTKMQQKAILDKYGGEEHLNMPDKKLMLGQTETYVEYSQDGKLIGDSDKITMSKWEEDHHPGNHQAIWGSFWDSGRWGYSCCYQMEKNAYCLGEAGRVAFNSSKELKQKRREETEKLRKTYEESLHKQQKEGVSKKDVEKEKLKEEHERQERLMKALDDEEKRLSSTIEELDHKKKTYNSFESAEVTDEQMEAYRLKRSRAEDPMAEYFENQRKKNRKNK